MKTLSRKDSLILALKQTNKEQLDLIDKLLRDCQVLEDERDYYKKLYEQKS